MPPMFMNPSALQAILTDPRATPMQRAAALSQLQGAGGVQRIGASFAAEDEPMIGVDADEALRIGSGAVGGIADEDEDTPDMMGDETGISDIPPQIAQMIRANMADESDMGDQSDMGELTKEDKALALARMGFGMAASQSPHLGVAIGQGGMEGLKGLADVRRQRAMERMRRDALEQQMGMQVERLAEQRRAAQERERLQADAIAQREEAARLATEQRERDSIRDAETRKIALDAAKERGDSAAEMRYITADRLRRDQYFRTGQWTAIEGDKEHNVTGPPETEEYSGPLVDSPALSFKAKEKLKLEQPKAIQSAESAFNSLKNLRTKADDLLKHKGLSSAVGFGGETVSKIPGTEAANFKANLNSLKTGIFTTALQAMRDASKTGGALGNVSNVEVEKMERLVSALDQAQSEDQMRENLQNLLDYTDDIGDIMRRGYIRTYGDKDAPELPWNKTAPDAEVPSSGIPPEAISQLRSDPSTAAQFDEIFGVGAAARILGK